MRKVINKILYILPDGDYIKVMLLLLLMLFAAVLEVIGIGMIPAFIAIVASPEQVMEHELVRPLLVVLDVKTAKDLLLWGSGTLVAIFIIKSIYILAYNYIEARYINNRRYLLNHRMMSLYMNAPYTFHLKRNTAELLRNVTQEVRIIINEVITGILSIAKEGVMITSILLFLLIVEPLITVVVTLFAGLGSGLFLLMTRKKVKTFGKKEQNYRKEMIKAVNQGLGGIKDARVLNREGQFIEKFRTAAYESSNLLTYIGYTKKIPQPMIETIAVIGMMMIAGLLVWQGRPMSAIIPILTLFGMAIVRLMPAVRKITTDYTFLAYNLVSVEPIYSDLKDLAKSNEEFLADRNKNERLNLKRNIEAKEITYSYPDSSEQVLKGVSFKIPKGSAVAFIGESGAGKTTIVDLLLGLLKPTEGDILVDGKNIHISLSAWQKNIGYIPQSIYLADETLRSNIAFGLPENQVNDEKVWQVLESAQLGKMVERLPEGLDTIIGEHGTRLSGGQRQRIGIARALYHNPEVLVMDEATSALDNITEKEITRAIDSLKGERTIIMIAHRLTTVQKCDRLYLMKNGKIIASGSYNDLVTKSIEFRKMAFAD